MALFAIKSNIYVEIEAETPEEAIHEYLLGLDNEPQHTIVNEFEDSLEATMIKQ